MFNSFDPWTDNGKCDTRFYGRELRGHTKTKVAIVSTKNTENPANHSNLTANSCTF